MKSWAYVCLSMIFYSFSIHAMDLFESLSDDEEIPLLDTMVPYEDIPPSFKVDIPSSIGDLIGYQPDNEEFITTLLNVTLPNNQKISKKFLQKAQAIVQDTRYYNSMKDADGSIFLTLDYLAVSSEIRNEMACQLYMNNKIFKKLLPSVQKIVLLNIRRFADIKKECLSHMQSRTELDMHDQELDSMDDFTITPSLLWLKKIDLSHNSLYYDHLDLFKFLPFLVALLLHHNQIEKFSSNHISNSLRLLDLGNNNIKKFPALALQSYEKLHIILDDNPLIDDEESLNNIKHSVAHGSWYQKKAILRTIMTCCSMLGTVAGLAALIDLYLLSDMPVTMYYDVYNLFNCQVPWNLKKEYSLHSILQCINRMVDEQIVIGDWPSSVRTVFNSLITTYNTTVCPSPPTVGVTPYPSELCKHIYLYNSKLAYAQKYVNTEIRSYTRQPQFDPSESNMHCIFTNLCRMTQPFPNFNPQDINVTFKVPPSHYTVGNTIIWNTVLGAGGLILMFCMINTFCSRYMSFEYNPCTISAQKTDRE